MFFTISYDIKEDQKRNLVRKTLEEFGTRVQFSVFECNITESQYNILYEKLKQIINNESDSVIFYCLCKACKQQIEQQGSGVILKEERFYII